MQSETERRGAMATVAQASEHLNISRSTLYVLMDRGLVPWCKLGNCRRIAWKALDEFINKNSFGGSER